jgi:mannose/fructose/N-acetylgalactosamine-specific phosphotransferase system component IID
MPDATMKEVMNFFEMPVKDFMAEWKQLDEESKAQIKSGLGTPVAGLGTPTYTY